MKKFAIIIIALLPCLLLAQIYYWVDASGVKHYSSFPPENREAVKDFMMMKTSAPVVPKNENTAQDAEAAGEDASTKQGEFVQEDPVLIFVENACPKCAVAVAWCSQNGIKYRELNIETSLEYRALYDKLGGLDTPYLIYGNRRIMGWNQEIVESWFDPNKTAKLEEQLSGAMNTKPVQ